MTTPPEKRKPGRPPGTTRTAMTDSVRVRMTRTQRVEYEARGGASWLRELLATPERKRRR